MQEQDHRSPSTSAGNKSCSAPAQAQAPNEDDIRAYAFHLYEQRGCTPGRDLEDWQEASACLAANIPTPISNTRWHQYVYKGENTGLDSHAPYEAKPAGDKQPAAAAREV